MLPGTTGGHRFIRSLPRSIDSSCVALVAQSDGASSLQKAPIGSGTFPGWNGVVYYRFHSRLHELEPSPVDCLKRAYG